MLLAGVAAGCASDDGDGARSVVLVTIDTLRADRVSAYGARGSRSGEPATTPNLDWLAARGARFENALAPSSSTAPTHASLLTGRLPSEHSIGAFNSQFALDEQWPTIAERASAAGYATAAVVSNPLLGRSLGLARGFDDYDDDTLGEGRFAAKGRSAERAVDRALAWLDTHDDGPFLLWLHLQDAHGPYAPPHGWTCPLEPGRAVLPPGAARQLPIGGDPSGHRAIPTYQVWDGARDVATYAHRYACEVRWLDGQLGRLLGRTAWHPALGDALVIVTADHGEAFGEDDFYFAHGHGVGLDQVRVPLLVAGPGVPAGVTIDAPVGLASLADLILGFALRDGRPPGSVFEGWRDVATAGPVFVESLNQVGVAEAGVFARRDLRPASDRAFWGGGNPNGGGAYWEPLAGPEVRALGTGRERLAAAGHEALLERLDAFAERVREARHERESDRRVLDLSHEQRAALEALGYAQ